MLIYLDYALYLHFTFLVIPESHIFFVLHGVRLENHLASPVMCQEQPESINHMFSNPPSFIYIEQEKVDGSVLGLVRKILGIQHLTI
jgi:hypothetical protein